VRVVLTLRVRDQADIVGAVVAFHLSAGVDFVIATDHRSEDATVEILESFERAGHLRLIRERGDQVRGKEWRNRMARLAATEHGADWVINADGDEFFWPRDGDLKEVLAAVPDRYGYLVAPSRVFVPVFDGPAFFAERMTVRLVAPAPINDPTSVYRPYAKLVHRGHPGVILDRGNHSLLAGGLLPVKGWHPVEVMHFPLRSPEQVVRKQLTWSRNLGTRTWGSYERASQRRAGGRLADYVSEVGVDAESLAAGLESRRLTRDTRLRDVLRERRVDDGGGASMPVAAHAVEYAVDVAMLAEAELIRLGRQIDLLEARVAAREPYRLLGRARSVRLRSSRDRTVREPR
jgi:hypothetical protein